MRKLIIILFFLSTLNVFAEDLQTPYCDRELYRDMTQSMSGNHQTLSQENLNKVFGFLRNQNEKDLLAGYAMVMGAEARCEVDSCPSLYTKIIDVTKIRARDRSKSISDMLLDRIGHTKLPYVYTPHLVGMLCPADYVKAGGTGSISANRLWSKALEASGKDIDPANTANAFYFQNLRVQPSWARRGDCKLDSGIYFCTLKTQGPVRKPRSTVTPTKKRN